MYRFSLGILFSLASLCPIPVGAGEVASEGEGGDHEHHVGWDIVGTGKHAGLGFFEQFRSVESWLMIVGLADVTFLLTLNEVKVQQGIEDADVLGPVGQKIGDVTGLVLNFGLIPIGTYVAGRIAGDEKATHFATELAATQIIATLETFGLSQIPFHKRPVVRRGDLVEDEGDFFNEFFRGQSSYPSGHMIGASVLMFKGWEWYGWRVGLPATLATVFIGWARIEEGQHYLTDIVGAVGVAGIASFATSRTRDLWGRLAIGRKRGAATALFMPLYMGEAGELVAVGQF